MPNLGSLYFDHTGWQPIEKNPHIEVWGDDIKSLSAVLSLEYFDKPPEIAVSLKDLNSIRFVYRSLANQSGAGLVSAEVLTINGIDCIEAIFKMPQPGRGFVYIGSLTIPFAHFSYVAKIQCRELGFTGTREAIVLDKMMDSGAELAEEGGIENWSQDPYDPDTSYPFMPNMSESASYDKDFPEHALSRVRCTLLQIRNTLAYNDELCDAERFDPSRSSKPMA